jgi:hypothetical protein
MLFVVAPVIGEGTNTQPQPAAQVIAATHPATHAQVAGAQGLASVSATTSGGKKKTKKKKKKKKSRTVLRRITISSRITDHPIVTEEGKGTYVGIKCPTGSKAISGGVVSPYINLLISSSSPNKPTIDGKYTPNVWWLAVTNVNVDGNGGTLSWHGVVNCVTPARLVGH